MKKAIGTIQTEIGEMTLFYNGCNSELTAEVEGTVEELSYTAKNLNDARAAVKAMYAQSEYTLIPNGWNFKSIK